MSSKRKADATVDDGDASPDARPSVKRSRVENVHHKNDKDEDYFALSRNRRLTLTKYGGKDMVDVREYYEQNGKSMPGKKGISLPMEQFETLVRQLPYIEALLAEKGIELPRPDYDIASKMDAGGRDGDGAQEDEDRDEHGGEREAKKEIKMKQGKANFEETSDEEEDDE